MTEFRFNQLSAYDGNTVSGYAIKWNEGSYVPQRGQTEVFKRGSLKIPESGISLDYQHNKLKLLGHSRKSLKLKEDDVGLWFECKLPDSAVDIKEAIKRGDVGGASIEFFSKKDSVSGSKRVVEDALLHSLSLVANPAHKGSISLRDKGKPKPKRKWSKALFTYPIGYTNTLPMS